MPLVLNGCSLYVIQDSKSCQCFRIIFMYLTTVLTPSKNMILCIIILFKFQSLIPKSVIYTWSIQLLSSYRSDLFVWQSPFCLIHKWLLRNDCLIHSIDEEQKTHSLSLGTVVGQALWMGVSIALRNNPKQYPPFNIS